MNSTTTEHRAHVVSLSAEEIVDALQVELANILELRDENHYRRGRPDEADDDGDEYDQNHTDHDSAWERWADATYKNNNRMGSHIATAQKLTAALHRWIVDTGEDVGETEV